MQLVESAQSILSRISMVSPNIGDDLLGSRTIIKHDLLKNHNGVIPDARDLAICNYKSGSYNAIANHVQRWTSSLDAADSFLPLMCPLPAVSVRGLSKFIFN